MSAMSTGIYQALGMHLETLLVLPELIRAEESVERESLVQLVEADHQQWPDLQASPYSTPTLQLAPQEWRLELEGIGWFRATGGDRLEWQRWDDSVSDGDIRTFAVTSGLGALAIQRGALVLHGTALERDGEAELVQQALDNTSINRLKKLEEDVDGFAEKPAGCERFFRSGRTGEGAEKLTIEQRQRLAKGLSGVMKRFQYEGP